MLHRAPSKDFLTTKKTVRLFPEALLGVISKLFSYGELAMPLLFWCQAPARSAGRSEAPTQLPLPIDRRKRAVQGPFATLSRLLDHRTNIRHLPYGIDDVQHQCYQPGQDQYADDDRIDVSMDALEYVHLTHLSSACAGSCSTTASFTVCWARMSRRRGQASFTRPI